MSAPGCEACSATPEHNGEKSGAVLPNGGIADYEIVCDPVERAGVSPAGDQPDDECTGDSPEM